MKRLLCILLFAVCMPALAAFEAAPDATFVRGAPLPGWARPLAPIPTSGRDDPGVVLVDEAQALVSDAPARLVNRVTRANRRAGIWLVGEASVDYYPSYQRLLLHRVAIIRGDRVLERTATATARLVEQEDRLADGIYGGARTLRLVIEDVKPGDALWLTYTVEGANPVFGRRWAATFSWDSSLPVELKRLAILHPKDRPLAWRQLGDYRDAKLVPAMGSHGKLRRIEFEGRGLDPVEYEEGVPADYLPMRMIQASEYRDWSQVAGWAAALFPEPGASAELDELVRRFAALDGESARATAALQWVQDEIRYFSVSIGENSHRPHAPAEVLRRRYGDCKDKTYLLTVLLNRLGIKAQPVLVNNSAPALPGRVLASPHWFDHAVVRLELAGKAYYVDPTRSAERGAVEGREPVLPGGSALVADAGTKGMTLIPPHASREPVFERFESFVAGQDGQLSLIVRDTYREGLASSMRNHFGSRSSAERQRSILARYEKRYPGITPMGDATWRDTQGGHAFETTWRLAIPGGVGMDVGGAGYRIKFDPALVDDTLSLPDNLTRKFPLKLDWGGYRSRYRMEVAWPSNVRGEDGPEASEVDGPFFKLRQEYTQWGSRTRYVLDYHVKQRSVAARDVPRLQRSSKLLSGYSDMDYSISPDQVAGKAEVAYRERAGDALRERFSKLAAVPRAPLAAAACDLYTSAVWLDEAAAPSERRAGIAAAIGKGGSGNRCAPQLRFRAGDFGGAAAAFRQLGDLASDDWMLPMRAWVRLAAGDSEGATSDMSRAFSAQAAEDAIDSRTLASAIALFRRAGKAPPPAMLALAGELTGDLYHHAIVGMLLGKATPEELLQRAAAMEPHEREVALNEAWFYIAQHYFAAGERERALDALRWYRDNGVVRTAAHELAMGQLWHEERGGGAVAQVAAGAK